MDISIHKTNKKKIYADYFLAFFTREISGDAEVWRLYTEDEGYNALSSSKGDVRISGDLYVYPGMKEISSTYYPLIGPYDTTDEDVAEFHVLLAKAAGIDGFIGEWAYEGMNRDRALLILTEAAVKYQFTIGVNWCEYGHFTWQNFTDRQQSIEAAKRGIVHLMEKVYAKCGIFIEDRPLLLLFDARKEKALSPKDAFFDPEDISELRAAARKAGYDPMIITRNESLLGTSNGFFPWVRTNGSEVSEEEHWTSLGSRQHQKDYLRQFYTGCELLQAEGKLDLYIGGIWQGFDDHKGQAWGTGQKRYIPRDGGQTLQDTWAELYNSNAEIAMIITWNDWEEASQIEPSCELGYLDLEYCARQISQWKDSPLHTDLLRYPEVLYRLRKLVKFLQKSGVNIMSLLLVSQLLDQAGQHIAAFDEERAAEALRQAEAKSAKLKLSLKEEKISIFWEFSLPSVGIEPVIPSHAIKMIEVDKICGQLLEEQPAIMRFRLSVDVRKKLTKGHFVGIISFEYLDEGLGFVRVYVDAAEEHHRMIAQFQKKNTGIWRQASLDLVNASFQQGLSGEVDLAIQMQEGLRNSIRLLRIDGVVYS